MKGRKRRRTTLPSRRTRAWRKSRTGDMSDFCRDLSDVAKGGDGAKSEAARQNSPGF